MTVTWQIPDSYDGDDDRDWQVIPAVKEIGPGKSETFSVTFIPSADDFYYSQELEAYATFKVRWHTHTWTSRVLVGGFRVFHAVVWHAVSQSNRSFRLVDDHALIPPWCLPVRVFGHTFPSTAQFLPKVTCNLPKLDPAGVNVQLYFPPCYLGESVYQTIQLSNPGGTPAFFQFFKDPTGVFEAKPMAGLIGACVCLWVLLLRVTSSVIGI
jgi:cilia- and flagella-associated protein 65